MILLNSKYAGDQSVKVLVTGSNGLIGKHMVRSLKASGYTVRTFDVTTGVDIRNRNSIRKVVKGIDAVIHLAAISGAVHWFEHPAEVAEVNINGTINLLEACRSYDVKRFIFASSFMVYGQPEDLPVREQCTPKPHTPYGLTKLVGEQYVNLYGETYGISTACMRYFSVYGIGQQVGLVADCLTAIKKNRPLFILGDGKQTRDFVNVTDVVQANLLALRTKASGTFNVGSGKETSVGQVVEIFQEMTDIKSVQHRPERLGEIRRIYADISQARRILGYRPKVPLRDGLAEILNAI